MTALTEAQLVVESSSFCYGPMLRPTCNRAKELKGMTDLSRTAIVVACVLLQAVIATDTTGRAMQPRRPNSGYHVNGAGGFRCGDMTNNLRTETRFWTAFYTSYAEGFMSGANFVSYYANQRNPNVGYDISPEALFASIEGYCRQNPMQQIHDAVESVYSRLATR
jgi:hypothetical protein